MPFIFAYGSNLDFSQMQRRCPSARFVSRAMLKDHVLSFPRRSIARSGGVAGVETSPGNNMWGVVYELNLHDLAALDSSEGYHPSGPRPNSYVRRPVVVYPEGDETHPQKVEIYYAVPKERHHFLPSQEYKDQILQGAIAWKLPEDYIAGLRLIKTKPAD